MTGKPRVLVIDDEDQELFILELELHGVDATHRFPDDLKESDLTTADLILVDEFITEWDERSAVKENPGLFVRDGVSLAGVLRANLEGRGPSVYDAPTPSKSAIVLRTGHLEVLAAGTPLAMRQVAVAASHDLEWVTEKHATPPQSYVSIARATAALPDVWDPAKPDLQFEWLRLPDEEWRSIAEAQVEQCRPPWSVLAATSAGRKWLAWMLQEILPFPTFLIDDSRAAALLGLSIEGFENLVAGDSPVSAELNGAAYRGALDDLLGRRWWRAGVNAMRRRMASDAGGQSSSVIAGRVSELHGKHLLPLGVEHPVFAIDEQYVTLEIPIEIDDAVRLQPDGWPVFADTPWAAIHDLGEGMGLARIVVSQDRESMEIGSEEDIRD